MRTLRRAGSKAQRALLDQIVDHGLVALRLGKDRELAIRARPLLQDPTDPLELVLRAEDLRRLLAEVEQLADERAHRDLLHLAEVDERAVEAVAHGAPLVLLDQLAAVLAEAEVAPVE